MEDKRVIDNRIIDLNWRALPLYDRLMSKKIALRDCKHCCKDRRRELRSMLRMSNLSLIIFLGCLSFIVLFTADYSQSLCWLFICGIVTLLLQRIEFSYQLMCLKEVKFLKKVKKRISH